MHINKINNKKYVGLTKQEVNRRWKNGNGYKGSTHFYNAIQKYGWDNFDHIVLETHLSKNEAESLEKQLIKEYNTQDENYGYNLESGGNAPEHSQETKDKLSKLLKGKKRSKEYCERMSIERKGKPGHPQSEESKKKMSEKMKGHIVSEEAKEKLRKHFSIPVLCVELNKVFPSVTVASEYVSVKRVTISAALTGRLQTAGGYHWQYYIQ